MIFLTQFFFIYFFIISVLVFTFKFYLSMFVNRRRESSSIYPKGSKVSLYPQFFIRQTQQLLLHTLFLLLWPLWLRHVESLSVPSTNVTRSPAPINVTLVVPICNVILPAHANGIDRHGGFSVEKVMLGFQFD